MRTVLVIFTEEGLPLAEWALHLMAAPSGSLHIVCVTKESSSRITEVTSADDDTPPLVARVLELAHADDTNPASVHDCRTPALHRGVLEIARELSAHRIMLHTSDDVRDVVRHLARAAPYDVLVVDAGGVTTPPQRVIVPQIGGGASHAIIAAAKRFGSADVPVIVLPDPDALPRSRRVFGRAIERLPDDRRAIVSAPDDAPPLDDALAAAVATGDLVLLDAEEADHVPRVLRKLRALRADRQDVAFTIGITRAEDAAGPGRLERLVERFRRYAPALTRDERRDLHELLDRGGRLSTDFVVMLTLSAAIAALGLIQSSTSVVIGAMLVAPLMTPLVAIGMALAQGNARLFGGAIRAMSIGVLGALVVSMLIGLISPWDDLSAEVVARGGPNLFDLAVALFSGVAASFALARPGLAGTLVGVAIAVALLPPLAAAGIATVKGEFVIAGGAAVLFLTNLLAIVVGSGIVFRLFGVDPALRGAQSPGWARITITVITIGLIGTTVILAHNLRVQIEQGVHRPWARPLAPRLRAEITALVNADPNVEILLMAESDIEHGFGTEVTLMATRPIDPELVNAIEAAIAAHQGSDHPTRILAVRSAIDPAPPDAP